MDEDICVAWKPVMNRNNQLHYWKENVIGYLMESQWVQNMACNGSWGYDNFVINMDYIMGCNYYFTRKMSWN